MKTTNEVIEEYNNLYTRCLRGSTPLWTSGKVWPEEDGRYIVKEITDAHVVKNIVTIDYSKEYGWDSADLILQWRE